MTNEININDTVRSFDFPAHRDIEGPDACFVEGIVEGFEGNHLVIKVTREVFEGEDLEVIGGRKVRAPLNGLRTSRGRITDGVVKIEEPKPANPLADMDLSNLTEDQLDAIRTLALAAEEHFDRLGAASEFAPKADRANRASIQAFKLIGRIRKEKENRTEAA